MDRLTKIYMHVNYMYAHLVRIALFTCRYLISTGLGAGEFRRNFTASRVYYELHGDLRIIYRGRGSGLALHGDFEGLNSMDGMETR